VSVPLQLGALLWGWSPVAMVSFWRLPLEGEAGRQLLLLMLAQPVIMVTATGAMAMLSRSLKCSRPQKGVLLIGAGLANTGFTLGAYVCYAVLEPGELALSYGMAFTMAMVISYVLFFYPLAFHYSAEGGGSLLRLIIASFTTVRAAPLYLSAFGVLLNLAEIPVPAQLDDWHILEAIFFLGAGAAYAGIGLRLRLGDSLGAWRMHILLAIVQFIVHPLATLAVLGLLAAAHRAPGPLVSDVLIVEAFMPTAINIVILANLFHLDARLASVLWLWNTLAFCAAVLPVLMWVY
jgi:predicted permease